jgi:hypothetical protein
MLKIRCSTTLASKTLSRLISLLDGLGFLNVEWDRQRGEVSSLAPSPWFIGKVAEHAVTLADFAQDRRRRSWC